MHGDSGLFIVLHERTIMSETVPLGTALGIKGQYVIIDYAISSTSLPDLVFERLPTIAGIARLVEWPVKRDSNA